MLIRPRSRASVCACVYTVCSRLNGERQRLMYDGMLDYDRIFLPIRKLIDCFRLHYKFIVKCPGTCGFWDMISKSACCKPVLRVQTAIKTHNPITFGTTRSIRVSGKLFWLTDISICSTCRIFLLLLSWVAVYRFST